MSYAGEPHGARNAAFAVFTVIAGGLALAACGGSSPAGVSRGTVVNVTERDFRIIAPTVVPAGDVTLRVRNAGPDAHELIVVRAARGRLPMRSDGLTVDEEKLRRREAGALEPGQPHVTRELRVQLRPGRYVIFCNMSGHAMGGMHTVVIAR